MENRDIYFNGFIENNGQLNEIELGMKLGLDEEETRRIIAQLLSEHKIEYVENRSCNYRLNKPSIRKKKNR